jgi:acetate kinase
VTIIVTVNTGSTSVKLAAFDSRGGGPLRQLVRERCEPDDAEAVRILRGFLARTPTGDVRAVAHRVVHGGERFKTTVRVTAAAESELRDLSALAPLHNPRALEWIAAARVACGEEVEQVAVFDTAFFASLPRVAAEYAVPRSLGVDAGVRRYGFHGLAHESMWRAWRALRPDLEHGGRIITLQLGGGASAAAIHRGQPVDTSMGFSPLEGLVMGTRSGDVDPAVVPFLAGRFGETADRIVEQLNTASGLLGVSGVSDDVSSLLRDPSAAARFALELYAYRARKYVGAYLAVLGGCDAVLFGGGVGEHVPQVRAAILEGMQWAGIELDPDANARAMGGDARISAAASRVAVHIVCIDEDHALARAAVEVLGQAAAMG